MNGKDIKQLLDNFYNGTTTPEEEQLLKKFFLDSPVPEEWSQEKEIFEKYIQITDIPLPDGLEERLNKRISAHISKNSSPTPVRSFRLAHLGGIAATVLICIGLFFGHLKQQETTVADTFNDPMEAAIVAEEALIFLSEQLNTGLGQVKEAREEITKINQSIFKQLKD